jgi:hypothetical protein
MEDTSTVVVLNEFGHSAIPEVFGQSSLIVLQSERSIKLDCDPRSRKTACRLVALESGNHTISILKRPIPS